MTWEIETTPEQMQEGEWEIEEPKSAGREFTEKYLGIKAPKKIEENAPKTKTYTPEPTPFQRVLGISPKERTEYLPSHPSFGPAALSGATLGLSELVPGLEVQKGQGGGGEFVGSLPTLTALQTVFSKPLIALAEKAPYFAKSLTSLAHITGSIATGATEKAVHEIGQGKMPSLEDVAENGLLWGIIDGILQATGKLGRFTKALFTKAEAAGKGSFEALNEAITQARKSGIDISNPEAVSAKVLSILEKAPAGTSQAVKEAAEMSLSSKKIDPKIFNRVSIESPSLAEPIQPESINPNQAAKELETTSLDNRISRVGKKAKSEMEFGETVQKNINENLENARKGYRSLYNDVKSGAKTIEYTPQKLAESANNILQEFQKLETKGEGYGKVLKSLETILQDTGYILERNLGGRITGIKAPAGEATNAANLIELGNRIGDIINYDLLEPSIKDLLRPLQRLSKKEARTALQDVPELLNKFESAEKLYGETARTYGRESIQKVRGTEAFEDIGGIIKKPTGVKDLKAVLLPDQFAQVERQILEYMKGLKHDVAEKYLNEISPFLNPQTRETAQKLVRSKLPYGKEAKIQKLREGVLDELSEAFVTGSRPKRTMDLWNTPKGQEQIRKMLKDNPNSKEIIKYLEEQAVNDFAKTIIKPDGTIDFKKFNELMRNPAVRSNLKHAGGQEAVSFFDNLESLAKQMEKNAKHFEKMQIPGSTEKAPIPKSEFGEQKLNRAARRAEPIKFKAKDLADSLGVPGKTLLGMIGYFSFGIPKSAAAYVGYKIIYKLATSPRVRRAIMKAAGERTNPTLFLKAIGEMNNELED